MVMAEGIVAWPRLQQTNSLAAAREQLEAVIASLLEAAIAAEASGEAQHLLADGQLIERLRVMVLLMDRLDQHPRPSDPLRMLLLDLLEQVKG